MSASYDSISALYLGWMTLLHVVISRDAVQLAEYVSTTYIGTFPETTYSWLKENGKRSDLNSEMSQLVPDGAQTVLSNDSRMTPLDSKFTIHCVNKDGLLVIAMVLASVSRQSVYTSLHSLHAEFLTQFGVKYTYAKRMELHRDFQSSMVRFASRFDSPADSLGRVKSQVQEVKTVVDENINAALLRGERLDSLIDKTEELEVSSASFKRKAVVLKKQMWWQSIKAKLMIILVLLACLYVGVSIGCGGPLWPKCVKKKSHKHDNPPNPTPDPTPTPPDNVNNVVYW